MTILQALILGIVQGITEFLPISSSGHLVIFPELFGWPLQDVAFDATIHLATLLVILSVFWRDIVEVVTHRRHLLWVILFSTIPVGLVGLWLERVNDLRSLPVVASSLAFWGAMLIFADWHSNRQPATSNEQPLVGNWRQTLLVTLSQAVALVPGTSRSGISIIAGLSAGLDRIAAARLAFLVGIPITAVAGLKKFFDIASGGVAIDAIPLFVGFLAAFFSGLVAVRWLLRFLTKGKYLWFGAYRLMLAALLFFVWMQ
ncbi:undecaprenyl-diphosphate phosphatase [Candidatus Uhrbacteria bacterium]|nr:undecaprenyl-diphosphate phosphatase [Candidatus Uhrbacteria bacterium]